MISVIFDMDGTLLDTSRIWVTAWDEIGRKQNIEGMGCHIKNVCGMNEVGWLKYLSDNFPTLDVDKFYDDVHRYMVENLVVRYMPGAKDILDYLKTKGVKMALASGSSRKTVDHHLKEVGADGYFDATVCSEDVKNGKPAPDVFLLAAEKLGVDPKDCFVFEDAVNGIKAANAAGMRCIAIPDIVDYNEETQKLLYAKLNRIDEGIKILKRFL